MRKMRKMDQKTTCNSKKYLFEMIEKSNKIAIAGHIKPDGDCLGSCLGFKRYVKDVYNKDVTLYLEKPAKDFDIILGSDIISVPEDNGEQYDLFVALDCGSLDRLGKLEAMFNRSQNTICIDHHVTNTGFAEFTILDGDASSTAELLCSLLDEESIKMSAAEALYTGIVHDTGLFRHSWTSSSTFKTAAMLVDKGVRFTKIVAETFDRKSFNRLKLNGLAFDDAVLYADGKLIAAVISLDTLKKANALASDSEGIINQLMSVENVEVAVLVKEEPSGGCKISLRSAEYVDVSVVCTSHGGGGHVRAAGCNVDAAPKEALDIIVNDILPMLSR